MKSRIEIGWLFDFYGPLLTERQRNLMALWCEEDLSLSEIAGEMEISRQAVSDSLHNAQSHLEEYEQKLGLLARYRRLTEGLEQCLKMMEGLSDEAAVSVRMQIIQLLSEESS